MKKFRARDFICGIVVGSVLFSGISYAASTVKLVVDGKEVHSDVAPQIIQGRTMIPARFLAEALGAKVDWDPVKSEVIVTSKEALKNPVLKTDQLSFSLQPGWTVEKGLDSYVIKSGAKTVGSLNLLGYAPSVDGLLPNGAEVLEKKKLEGTGLNAYSVKLVTRSSAASSQPETQEIHYYYFLASSKVVYDLSFNLAQVSESTALSVAQSVQQ